MQAHRDSLEAIADEVVAELIEHADADLRSRLQSQRAVLQELHLSDGEFSASDFVTGQVRRALGL